MARDIAKTDAYRTSRRERKKVEVLFAHLKRILRLDRLRLRGPCGARDEFLPGKLASARHLTAASSDLQYQPATFATRLQKYSDFFNRIGQQR